MLKNGFEGQKTTASARSIASAKPCDGAASSAPSYVSSSITGSQRRLTKYSWNDIVPSLVRTTVRTRASVIGTIAFGSPKRAQSSAVTVRQRPALAQELRAPDVRREVTVAQPEPRIGAELPERLQHPKRLVLQAPARDVVGALGQRVHHRVEVGGHMQPVKLLVIARIHNDRQRLYRQNARQPKRELRTTHSTGQRQHMFRHAIDLAVSLLPLSSRTLLAGNHRRRWVRLTRRPNIASDPLSLWERLGEGRNGPESTDDASVSQRRPCRRLESSRPTARAPAARRLQDQHRARPLGTAHPHRGNGSSGAPWPIVHPGASPPTRRGSRSRAVHRLPSCR